MRFLIDEDVAIELDRCLQQNGHDAISVDYVLGFPTEDSDICRYASL
jgi:predicted nuclease of predicted toxin-antitoxin system